MWNFFEKLVKPFPDEAVIQPPSSFFKFIAFYTKGMWRYIILIAITSAFVAIGEALFFYYLGKFVDVLSQSSPDTFWQEHSDICWQFSALLLLGLPLMILVHNLLLNQTIRVNFPTQIRYRMHRYLLRQSMSFFASDFAGRLVQKLMQTSMGVRDTVLKFFNVIVHMLVYFVTMLGMLAGANIYLMLIMLLWLVIYVLIMCYFIPKLREQSKDNAEKRSIMVGGIVDSYSNIQTVKLFSRRNHEEGFAKEKMQNCVDSELTMMRLVTKFNLSVQYLNYLLIFGLVATSIFMWAHNIVLVGAIAVSLGLAIRVNNLSQWVMWEVGMLFENIGNIQNGMETMAKPLTVCDPETPVALPSEIKGQIDFKNVSFAYNQNNQVFSKLNLSIKPGEKIGIVGQSGGGKSTLVNLLLRFYDINDGSITIDGIDIRSFNQDDLRSIIAMVAQDISLLHRSIKENILYGNEHTSKDLESSMRDAAQKAMAIDFIEMLSDTKGNTGFDTLVGERGVRLSGGQRQRIALARVIMKNAPILILDEATSALDSEVETIVKDNLDRLMENKTVIAIAHRLSTIAAMDRLIVLKEGVIVEEGSHDELLSKNGVYATLWKKQTNGFLGV